MRQIITNEFGQVKIGSVLLPGNFQEMDIEGGIKTDEITIKGTSGTSKQPQGYKDVLINLTLELPTDDTDTCYDKLKRIVTILYNVDKSAKPYIYDIVNKHTAIWNVKKVIFETLNSREDNKTDTIIATLVFKEWKPVIVNNESRRKKESILPANDFSLPPIEPIDDYVTRHVMAKKIASTPAIDDDYIGRRLQG
jgi:hypothetical protein